MSLYSNNNNISNIYNDIYVYNAVLPLVNLHVAVRDRLNLRPLRVLLYAKNLPRPFGLAFPGRLVEVVNRNGLGNESLVVEPVKPLVKERKYHGVKVVAL